jgi:hypothetical protein
MIRKDTVTGNEIRLLMVRQELAASRDNGKSLNFRHDIGRGRTYFDVRIGTEVHTFDYLMDAIDAYNEG